jgi:hypothetical protein
MPGATWVKIRDVTRTFVILPGSAETRVRPPVKRQGYLSGFWRSRCVSVIRQMGAEARERSPATVATLGLQSVSVTVPVFAEPVGR